jgi:glyoxylate/hydroxypyruvate reductase A
VKPKVLFMVPPAWVALGKETFASPLYDVLLHGRDDYRPEDVEYFVGFRPPPGFLKSLPKLKLVISFGAGVDGFLADPEFPRNIRLVRFTEPALAYEMAQHVAMHALIIHRQQRFFDKAQAEGVWRQIMMPRATSATRMGILGMGEIGGKIAERLAMFGFPVSGWSKTRKNIAHVKSYAGDGELDAFLGECDILAAVLPQTPETINMMNKDFFAKLPKGAWIINVARGSIVVDEDLIAALDSGQLGGAVLDVFRTEPLPADHPFWKHPKVTITPHIAGLTSPYMALAYVENCVRKNEAGEPLADIVDMDRGY